MGRNKSLVVVDPVLVAPEVPVRFVVLDKDAVLPKFGFSDSGELLRRVVRGVRDSRRRNLIVVIVGEGGSVVGD